MNESSVEAANEVSEYLPPGELEFDGRDLTTGESLDP